MGFKYKKNSQLKTKEEFPSHELNKCLQKFYLSARKCDDSSVICTPNLQSLGAINELKLTIFVLNYLTVLVYRNLVSNSTSHLHFSE